MQIIKCKDTDPPNKFYIHVREGWRLFLLFLQHLTLSQSPTHSFTILRRWSWLRSELHKPLIIPELNHFDGVKKFAETAASREEGTWGEKQGSCSNKDFLLPGGCWQLTHPLHTRTSGWSQETCWIKQDLFLCLPSVFPNLAPWFCSSMPPRARLTRQH